ncbi:beta-1,3-N-acetylglucosaminyltransferase lunatic protein, putative [Actinidia rufa]|uniref:Beta-1,3-N-acetylglucosaminyltransferase lunatic protein, putative n=1 Tax=Actinidia rufa TaxID=165716 RepID=A0A7J0FDR7_9ERIC|nr:beta-1,3-N-acetylglucosaminyltransferase lunatic protein, putative [Actinidia rufa]
MSQTSDPSPTREPLKSFKLSLSRTTESLTKLLKASLFILLVASISLVLYSAFKSPTRWLRCPECHASTRDTAELCEETHNLSTQNLGPTNISHIVFGIGGSAKTWTHRRHYSELWWRPNITRGFVWLDETPRIPSGPRNRPRTTTIRCTTWGANSESVEQDVIHSYEMAFGGGGFAISYPLAAELVNALDGCLDRYYRFYGSDQRVWACVSEFGVSLTRERGFHQIDIRGDPYGLLAAHPVAPLVTLHHLNYVDPLFPGRNRSESLQALFQAYRADPAQTLQQSICHERKRKWSVSISWGYTAQIYPSLMTANVLATPVQTFRSWRTWSDGPFMFNTRPAGSSPCDRPVIYFLDKIEDAGEGQTLTSYKVHMAKAQEKCGGRSNGCGGNCGLSIKDGPPRVEEQGGAVRWMQV